MIPVAACSTTCSFTSSAQPMSSLSVSILESSLYPSLFTWVFTCFCPLEISHMVTVISLHLETPALPHPMCGSFECLAPSLYLGTNIKGTDLLLHQNNHVPTLPSSLLACELHLGSTKTEDHSLLLLTGGTLLLHFTCPETIAHCFHSSDTRTVVASSILPRNPSWFLSMS